MPFSASFGRSGCSEAVFGPGSLMRDLENILACPNEGHRINGCAVQAYFVMKV